MLIGKDVSGEIEQFVGIYHVVRRMGLRKVNSIANVNDNCEHMLGGNRNKGKTSYKIINYIPFETNLNYNC